MLQQGRSHSRQAPFLSYSQALFVILLSEEEERQLSGALSFLQPGTLRVAAGAARWRERKSLVALSAAMDASSSNRPPWWPTSPKQRNTLGSLEGALQVSVGSASRERRPSREVPALATSSRTLKDEDAVDTLVAHICGEMVKLLLVADGHGGPAVAQLCATVGLRYLVEEVTVLGDASTASVHAACVRTFEHLHERAVLLSKSAGATLTIAVWNESRGELTVAHAGDSSAMLVEATSLTLLTDEHRLDDSPEERTRVQARAPRRARVS